MAWSAFLTLAVVLKPNLKDKTFWAINVELFLKPLSIEKESHSDWANSTGLAETAVRAVDHVAVFGSMVDHSHLLPSYSMHRNLCFCLFHFSELDYHLQPPLRFSQWMGFQPSRRFAGEWQHFCWTWQGATKPHTGSKMRRFLSDIRVMSQGFCRDPWKLTKAITITMKQKGWWLEVMSVTSHISVLAESHLIF